MQAGVARLEARGWLAGGALSDDGLTARRELEAVTDRQEQHIIDALGQRLDDVCHHLNAWGRRCVEQGVFTADPLKRAAG